MRNAVAAGLAAILGMGSAHAGDLQEVTSLKDVPAPAVCVTCWGGLYVGTTVGFGVGETHEKYFYEDGTSFLTNHWNINGEAVGAFVDYNFSNGPLVYGVEGHFNFTNIDGHFNEGYATNEYRITRELEWYGGVNFRAGYAPGNILYYAFVGPVWGEVKSKWINNTYATGITWQDSNSATHFGWEAGAGIEWAMNECWVTRVEYQHIDFDTKRTFAGTTVADDWHHAGHNYHHKGTLDLDRIKIGISYKLRGREEAIPEVPLK